MSERVGKGDLMEVLQGALELKGIQVSVVETAKIIEAMADSITKLMKERGKVNIPAFGTFVVVRTDPRRARNPKTGEEVQIPEKFRPKFKAAQKLQQVFNPVK